MKYLKTLFFLLLLIAVLPLSGCKNAQDFSLSDLPLPENRACILKTGAGEYTLELTVTAPHEGRLVFLAPKSISGVAFSRSGENGAVSYGELTLPLSLDAFPEKGLLTEAFSLPADSTFLRGAREENGKTYTVYTCVNGGENFLFWLDENGGLFRVDCEGASPFSAVFESG